MAFVRPVFQTLCMGGLPWSGSIHPHGGLFLSEPGPYHVASFRVSGIFDRDWHVTCEVTSLVIHSLLPGSPPRT